MINTDSQYEQYDNGRLARWVSGEQVGLSFVPFQPSLFQGQLVSMSITFVYFLCFSAWWNIAFPPLDIDIVERPAKRARALETKKGQQQRKQTACGWTFSLIFGLIFPIFLNCSEEILPVAFQKCFRFGPSSSRTRARDVWSWWHWRWWWWWFVAPLSSKLQTALARVVDESGPKRIHF